jgi:hypothetical protein
MNTRLIYAPMPPLEVDGALHLELLRYFLHAGQYVRHLRGRTIYALPDRVVYGYFDTLARYIMESGEWQLASNLPPARSSRDFA